MIKLQQYNPLINSFSVKKKAHKNFAANIPVQSDKTCFSGNCLVDQEILGENIKIPQNIYALTNSVKRIEGKFDKNKYTYVNACYLGNGLFLTANHLFYDKPVIKTRNFEYLTIEEGLGKSPGNSLGKVELQRFNHDLDLAICKKKENSPSGTEPNPVNIAESTPEMGEEVYLIGVTKPFKENKVIPAVIKGKLETDEIDTKTGIPYSMYQMHSKILEKNKFNCSGFSGSPVFNKSGKLIGVVCCSFSPHDTGEIYITGLESIKPFIMSKK